MQRRHAVMKENAHFSSPVSHFVISHFFVPHSWFYQFPCFTALLCAVVVNVKWEMAIHCGAALVYMYVWSLCVCMHVLLGLVVVWSCIQLTLYLSVSTQAEGVRRAFVEE